MPTELRLHPAPVTVVSLAVILALSAAGLVTSSSASTARSRPSRTARSAGAAAKQPKCGDTITTDTTLHHDLVNCPNNGIVIGADDVTLDLNYHTIDGDGTPFAACAQNEFCDAGVLNDGHDGITVVHGSVREFDVGVLVGEARHTRLLGISSSGNRFAGLGFFASTRSLMRNSSGSGSTSREDGGSSVLEAPPRSPRLRAASRARPRVANLNLSQNARNEDITAHEGVDIGATRCRRRTWRPSGAKLRRSSPGMLKRSRGSLIPMWSSSLCGQRPKARSSVTQALGGFWPTRRKPSSFSTRLRRHPRPRRSRARHRIDPGARPGKRRRDRHPNGGHRGVPRRAALALEGPRGSVAGPRCRRAAGVGGCRRRTSRTPAAAMRP